MRYIVITGTALIVLYAFYKTYERTHIDKDLGKLIDGGAIILDVRTAIEYKDGHIRPSINIPLGRLRTEYRQLDTSRSYITCCSHGLRSVKAVELLKERGFKHVYNGGPWTGLEVYCSASGKPRGPIP